jgi:hypothetical protein
MMFWGCFSYGTRGPLTVVNEKLNAQQYLKLVQDIVEPELEASSRPLTFMQDNGSAHKANVVMDYLTQKRITPLAWPPQSPDLNPVELVLFPT